ncbi:GNAT family N-acetyltransferase [Rhizobium sp. MHM7A]|uniref:GNAT family N-acetyltransferase n=1 Tax=Rhizobium sp. MHM7A TaxID=2583233 RepID=UPI001107575C|nr:GNAT family N-acetyltransferase [Rhizobium sp. MHM7A]TLX11473.1 GNAT family N-acetyltransferase [Rhizobium sp. MHM7A]
MTWTIRPPRAEDQVMLADIYLSVRRQTFVWVDPGKFHREDFSAHTNGETIFVCDHADGGLAGFLSLWPEDDFIHMLYIRPEFQGLGAGTALLQALPEWPQHKYRLKCLVKNRRAKAFYLSRGFAVTGNGASPEGDYEELSFHPV